MWLFLLYGLAAVIALKTLLTLMERHRKIHLHLLKQEKAKADFLAAQAEKIQQAADEQQQLAEQPAILAGRELK